MLFVLIKSSSFILFKFIIVLISFLSLVTIKDRSVPPFKNCDFGFLIIIFFNSDIVDGEKYFLSLLIIDKFLELIFFNILTVFFLFLKKLSLKSTLFKLFAASTIGLYPVHLHKFPEIVSFIKSELYEL